MNSVKFFIILILISFTQASPTLKESSLSWNDGDIERQPRIVNGTDATIEEFPFILSIHNLRINETTNETYFAYTCGGSILNSRWFLTVRMQKCRCFFIPMLKYLNNLKVENVSILLEQSISRVAKSIQIKICASFNLLTNFQAAHCVTGANPARHLIKYATTDITNVESRIAYMEQLFMHEDYNATIVSNDIAVGKVKDPFEINILGWQQKLPLRYQYFPTGTPAVLAGNIKLNFR